MKLKKKVTVLGKDHFDAVMKKTGLNDGNMHSVYGVAFISINDTNGTDEKPYFSDGHFRVLNLFFDDVEEDINKTDDNGKIVTAKSITPEQADNIVKFIEQNIETKVKSFIVHCTAGVSRSGAVGLFIAENYMGMTHEEFMKDNPYTLPNLKVMALLKRAKLKRELRNILEEEFEHTVYASGGDSEEGCWSSVEGGDEFLDNASEKLFKHFYDN